MTKLEKENVNKILCIKPRGIGDILLSTIILENLKNYFTNASIDYLVDDFAREALIHHPLVNKVITMGKKELSLKVALRIRKEKYDLILDLWSNPRSAQITFFSRVKFRAGYSYRGRRYAYNILATSERGDYHSAEHNLRIIEALNVPVISKNVSYFISEEDENYGKEFFKNQFENEKIIGIIPSGSWISKRCEKEKWVSICKKILEHYKVKFFILWGPGDEVDANFIKISLDEKAALAPPTGLNKMAALINQCGLIISNDSGPMHISAALGRPTLGLFGPTNPQGHRPYSPNSDFILKEDLFCITCNLTVCPFNHECMNELSEELILEKIKKLTGESLQEISPA
jgi:lipopolysaccharide heptosyltransferase II